MADRDNNKIRILLKTLYRVNKLNNFILLEYYERSEAVFI